MKKVTSFVLAIMFALGFSLAFVLNPSNEFIPENEPLFKTTLEVQETSQGISVRGGNIVRPVHEIIRFHRREIQHFAMAPNMPIHMSGYHCGATAGGSKIAFYQRIHRELIPGHNPGMQIGHIWAWSGSSPQVRAMFSDLQFRMGADIGVTIQQYYLGIASYVVSRGLSMTLGNVTGPNNTLAPSFFTTIRNGRPVSLFLNGFNVMSNAGFDLRDDFDSISFVEYAGRHVMVAYGYRIFSYFDENDVMFRQDIYLNVHTATVGMGRGFIRISSHSRLESALVTHIHPRN